MKLISKGRAKRIATGSGTTANEVTRLTSQFEQMQKMTAAMASGGFAGKLEAAQRMSQGGGMPGMGGGGGGGMSLKGSSATPSIKAKFKERKKR